MARIMVVEDFEPTLLALESVLTRAGHQAILARDGAGVVEQVRADPPDLLITDILMPEKDGLVLIQEIRRFNPALPILAISGGGVKVGADYLDFAADFGANGVLVKPFRWQDLLDQVDALLA